MFHNIDLFFTSAVIKPLSCVQHFYDPVDWGPPDSSVHGIPQVRILDRLPFPSPGDLPDPGIKALYPALAGGLFTIEPTGKPFTFVKYVIVKIKDFFSSFCPSFLLSSLKCLSIPSFLFSSSFFPFLFSSLSSFLPSLIVLSLSLSSIFFLSFSLSHT